MQPGLGATSYGALCAGVRIEILTGFTLAVTLEPARQKVRYMSYQSASPFVGTLDKTFAEFIPEQLEQSLADANDGYAQWRTRRFVDCAAVLHEAAALVRANVDAFARLATLETGKRITESRGEVSFSTDILGYYAERAEGFLAPHKLHPVAGEAHMESSALGVLFCVEPWNFPFYQLARVAGPQLMAGNVLVVKHAGCVPQCAMAFKRLLLDAGAPKGLYTNLFISHDQSDPAIDSVCVKAVPLTGRKARGQRLASRIDTGMMFINNMD